MHIPPLCVHYTTPAPKDRFWRVDEDIIPSIRKPLTKLLEQLKEGVEVTQKTRENNGQMTIQLVYMDDDDAREPDYEEEWELEGRTTPPYPGTPLQEVNHAPTSRGGGC